MKHTTLQRKRVHFTRLFTRAELRIACSDFGAARDREDVSTMRAIIAQNKNDHSTMRAINVKLLNIENLLGY